MISYSVRPWAAIQKGIRLDSNCENFAFPGRPNRVFRLIFVILYANLSRLIPTGYLLMALSGIPMG
jgi:hypothetical protein